MAGWRSASTEDLRAEAEAVEGYIDSVERRQKASGASDIDYGDDSAIAQYQHRLGDVNGELKRRS
ncbi:hypothetical protein OG785_45480 [Streptomyces sp. NBC_00006]|uniref:hypothetical protein n=1 Tax=Streptomyces sp. NBC_00006 TaxID=2975619 RepID=UPI00225641BF|nr:hypothetical protein [Streptomyces sp. NBC_00006]MCX5528956.1 hypothetical protein [Streptomyces sp. NBC_00006]MCX5537812.1 hypothetical protein [Streptomyces sp. NBC_00006]